MQTRSSKAGRGREAGGGVLRQEGSGRKRQKTASEEPVDPAAAATEEAAGGEAPGGEAPGGEGDPAAAATEAPVGGRRWVGARGS